MSTPIDTKVIMEWVGALLRMLGWPALISIIWLLRGTIDKMRTSWEKVDARTKDIEALAVHTKANVDTVVVNHLTHLQERVNDWGAEQKEATKTLISMDGKLGILVYRNQHL